MAAATAAGVTGREEAATARVAVGRVAVGRVQGRVGTVETMEAAVSVAAPAEEATGVATGEERAVALVVVVVVVVGWGAAEMVPVAMVPVEAALVVVGWEVVARVAAVEKEGVTKYTPRLLG